MIYLKTCKETEDITSITDYIFPSIHIQLMGSNGCDCCTPLAWFYNKYFISTPSIYEYLPQIKEKWVSDKSSSVIKLWQYYVEC